MNVSLDIPAYLDRRPMVWTFTMLHTYKNICPYQAAERFVYKKIPFVETAAMKFGNEVHSAFEFRVGSGKPLPDSMRQWEVFATPFDGRNPHTELRLGITREGHATGFFDQNVWGRGKADCVVVQDTNAYLGDWKTGNSKYEDPFELRVQAVLLHAKFPQLKTIKANYVWLKEHRFSHTYDVSDTQATWNEINQIVGAIEDDRKVNKFEKREGPLCKHCPCFDCEYNKNQNVNT